MPQTQHRLMTLDEKLAIGMKAIELEKAGNEEEATRIFRTVPIPSYIAKVMKDKMGASFLIEGGWNLAEAEAEFGRDWLSK